MRFLLILLLSFPCLLYAQENFEQNQKIGDYIQKGDKYLYQNQDSAYHFFKKAYDLAIQEDNWESSIEALYYEVYTSGYYYNLPKYKRAIDRMDSLLLSKRELIGSFEYFKDAKISNILYKLDYNFTIKDFNNARKALSSLLDNLENRPIGTLTEDNIENLFSAYQYAGAIYKVEKKYNISEEYYKKSLRLFESNGMEKSKKLTVYNLLASLYTAQKEYKKSNKFFSKTLEIHLSDKNRFRNNIITSSILVAQNYIELAQLDSAKYFLNMTKSVMLKNDPFSSRYYNKLAALHIEEGKAQLAFEMYNQSLTIQMEKWEGAKNPAIANVFNKIGQLHESQNNIKNALKYYQKALQQLTTAFNSNNLNDNPGVTNSKNNGILFVTLKNKSGALNKANDFSNSLSSVNLAIVALDSLKPTFESEGDKQLLIENAFPLFETGIEAAFQLYKSTDNKKYIDQAFFYSEKGKSVILLEALLKTRANNFGKIPPEIVEKEKQLKSLITYLEKRIRRKKNTDLEEQLFDVRNEYRQFIKTIETRYKKYYDLKYNTEMATVAMVQNHLKSEETLVSYFYGDQAIYVITLGKKSKEFYKVKADHRLGAQINMAHEMLSNPKSDSRKLATLTYELYKRILQPSLQNKRVAKLTIITDGLLNYIPFGSLNTSKDDIQYLIEDVGISYSSSATLLLQLKAQYKGNNDVLAFAPSFNSTVNSDKKYTGGLLALPNNKAEVQQILTYFQGKSYVKNDASLQNLNAEVSNYGIIHLATHAVVNDNTPEYSYLAFSPKKQEEYLLYVSDIYNLELNANLVTLSACESGIGDLKRGEGLISLSRAFFYSGAASIVNTMWKINDASTSQIMDNFYKHLADGKSKEVALQNAKLDFLKENKQNPLTHPYFWSGFVIAGDTTPVVEKKPIWIWIVGGLFLLVFLGLLAFRRVKLLN